MSFLVLPKRYSLFHLQNSSLVILQSLTLSLQYACVKDTVYVCLQYILQTVFRVTRFWLSLLAQNYSGQSDGKIAQGNEILAKNIESEKLYGQS